MDEIKKMGTLQVNMWIQRHNEPYYKQEIDRELMRSQGQNGRR
jgi:hypothetical protein